MRIFYINAKRNKANAEHIHNYVEKNDIDLLIVSEGKMLDLALTDDYKYTKTSEYTLGMVVYSKYPIQVTSIDYEHISKRTPSKKRNKDRIYRIEVRDYTIMAVHLPTDSFNNPLSMFKILDEIQTNSYDIIIGDFNSGYIEDSLDEGGLTFVNGITFFNKFEELGFINHKKGKGEFSYIHNVGRRRFRIDHTFTKNSNDNLTYVDFLAPTFDHKGMLLEVSKEELDS